MGDNDKAKTFKLDKAISAVIVPGKKSCGHEKSGDAIYIDAKRKILALADGPERNPLASSHFLERFKSAIEEEKLKDLSFEKITGLANSLVHNTKYHDATTFSGVVLSDNSHTGILHAGDSLVFKIKSGSGEITQLSRTNHVLIGRSQKLFQTGTVSVDPDDMIFLATDGFIELSRCYGCSPKEFLSRCITDFSPAALIANILQFLSSIVVRLDDIALIAVCPKALTSIKSRKNANIILKG
jgi:serine/threonine protein phosphatase PrpC